MKFTDKQLKRLEEAWKNGEELILAGVNGYGVEFTTIGRVTTDDGKMCVCDVFADGDCKIPNGAEVYLEFGQSKSDESRSQTNYFAPYRTDLKQDKYFIGFDLYVLGIKGADGETIYENANAQEILGETKQAGKENQSKLVAQRRDLTEKCIDPVTAEAMKRIGQQIILAYPDGSADRGVLASVGGMTTDGSSVCIEIRRGSLCGGIHVTPKCALFVEKNDGTVEKVADNRENGLTSDAARAALIARTQHIADRNK